MEARPNMNSHLSEVHAVGVLVICPACMANRDASVQYGLAGGP